MPTNRRKRTRGPRGVDSVEAVMRKAPPPLSDWKAATKYFEEYERRLVAGGMTRRELEVKTLLAGSFPDEYEMFVRERAWQNTLAAAGDDEN